MPTAGIVDKTLSIFIEQQFPAVYKESGAELVALTKEYYKWMETAENQSIYNARRMFEYRDISTTLDSMLIYFKNKYMADLPLDEAVVRVLVRNILDLYQRKGSAQGITLFFRMFYNEDVEISYPAARMLKVSDSNWKTGNYLQLFPNKNLFTSGTGVEYSYKDLLSRNITGSFSGAKAAVDKINTIRLNGILTPIIYIDKVKGAFKKNDQIITNIGGEEVGFGYVDGSLSELDVDESFPGTVGNEIGDLLTIRSDVGVGGQAIVTGISEDFDGQVNYQLTDGGWGYSLQNTRLLVSQQLILFNVPDFVATTASGVPFVTYERITDTQGVSGVIVGQTDSYIAVYIDSNPADAFALGNTISTSDRANNISLSPASITVKNSTSPGPLFPDTAGAADVKVSSLLNTETVNLIGDIISPYASVALNSTDYGLTTPMSGTASPVTINTVLTDAFDTPPLTIGTIADFQFLNPGTGYTNDVMASIQDSVFAKFEKRDQNIIFETPTDAFDFSVGAILTEETTNRTGIIRSINNGYLTITPYTYYGFDSATNNVLRGGASGILYNTVISETSPDSPRLGENATITSLVSFEIGEIETAAVFSSGFGYPDGTRAELINSDGIVAAEVVISSDTQGTNSGYWSSQSSHINGFTKTVAEDGVDEYYDSKMRVQDSDYFQEYSYELKSMVDPKAYTPALLQNVHLAGTKVFNQFLFKAKAGTINGASFIRFFNDDGNGSVLDQQDINEITSDILNFTVDSDVLTADNFAL